MKIVGTTNAEKRRDKRMAASPLTIELDGVRYTVESWSMGGFQLTGYAGGLKPEDTAEICVIFGDEPKTISRLITMETVRVNRRKRILAARFVDLDDESYNMLEGWISGSLRRVLRAD